MQGRQTGLPPGATASDLFGAGLKLHQAGRLVEAEALYRQTLAAHPNHPDALHLLGVIASQTGQHELSIKFIELAIRQDGNNSLYHSNRGLALQALKRFEDALESYDRALALRPDYAEALFNRGVTLQRLRRLPEAVDSYDRAIAVCADHAEALSNRGVALQDLGRLPEALESYGRALAVRPNFAEALCNRGNALKALKRLDHALESYNQALALRPNDAEVLYNRGNVFRELGRLEEAVASYDRALAACPEHADALSNRGTTLEKLGRFDDALHSYDLALTVRADFGEALSNRGNTLKALRRFEEALESYDRALAIHPERVEVIYNRGVTLQELRRFAEALESYDRALAVLPDHAEALCNRGVILQELGRFADALESYDRALAIYPHHVQAQWNRALVLLLIGSFTEGWLGYEWRRKLDSWIPRSFQGTEWSGDSLAGKRILLYAEQGFGDAIQFARYASLAAARGARVVLEVHPPLKSLLTGLSGVDVVVARGEPLPPCDMHCSLLSLPLMFGTTVDTIPADVPYIRPTADRYEKWRKRLPQGLVLVGLAWSGSQASIRDHQRSIPFEQLAPVLTVPGIQFVSLQKDVRTADACALRQHSEVIDFGEDIKDFSDTCAAIAQLDIIISVDTAVAHLAGAMDKPVWILLPHIPDFRWLLGRDDSPWYPSARLFRKTDTGNWGEVISCLKNELAIARPSLFARRSKSGA